MKFSATFRNIAFMATAMAPILLASCAAKQRASYNNEEVRFIVFGDSQFAHTGVYERLVHEANMLRPDFVIQVGDMIQGYTYDADTARGEWELFKSQIEPLEVPFYPVPGNHDVVTPATEMVYTEVWGPDKLFYSFDMGNLHGIVLDTYYGEEDDRIADWQRQWLKEDLARFATINGGVGSKRMGEKSIFVFMHSPIWRYRPEHQGYKDWLDLHETLKQYPVKLVVGGHTHEFAHDKIDGIDYLVMNSSGNMLQDNERSGFFHSMLHVSVKPEGDVRYAVSKAGSILPIDTVNSEERKQIFRYDIPNGVFRLSDWIQGEPYDGTVALELENPLEFDRDYFLQWQLPRDSGVLVEPFQQYITIPAGATESIPFQLSSDAAPAEELMPYLKVTVSNELRTGYVSRDWEDVYTERQLKAESDSSIQPTNIPLKKEVTWTGIHKLFVPPAVTATRWVGPLEIDGKLEETNWKSGDAIDDISPGDGSPADTKTRVRFLYDDDYLYVGAWMEEPNPAGMKANAEGDIPLTWSDDDFELFFDPENDQREYNRIFQNYKGTRFNAATTYDPETGARTNDYFPGEYESAIFVGEDYWSLEARIPWSDLGAEVPPTEASKWGLQIGRNRQQSDNSRWVWSSDGLYNQKLWGLLDFQ